MQPLIRNQSKTPLADRMLGAAEALGWAVAGVLLARALWLAATPAGPLGTPPVAAAAAASPLALAGSDPFFPHSAAAPDAVSSLDLILVGTRVDAASARGSAIIATPDGAQQSIGVGEDIMPGVKLVAVDFESVTLDRSGARETLYIDQSPAMPTREQPEPNPAPTSPAAQPGAATK